MLGEDEDLLHEIAMDMEPGDGRLSVLNLDDDASTVAFMRFGIEHLKELPRIARRSRHRQVAKLLAVAL